MRAWAAPAVIGGGQLLVGLVFLLVGVGYDYAERAPGLLTIAALIFLGGPGFGVALLQAQRRQIAAPDAPRGEHTIIVERRELEERGRR